MLSTLIKRKLRELPDKPGCYLMRDRRGRIIYIGKAASLRQRVRSYFQRAARNRADPKLRGLVKSIADLDIIVRRNEAEAILTEGKLIKDYRPRYNLLFKDDKRFPMLRVELSRPFPRIQLCRLSRNDGAAYFGPYASSAAARQALEFVEKHYGLRKCAPLVPTPAEHKHCINDIVRFCAAPCIGKVERPAPRRGASSRNPPTCPPKLSERRGKPFTPFLGTTNYGTSWRRGVTRSQYRERVAEACAFLRGERPAVLKELEAAMEAAAQALAFEKAAALRDTVRLLREAVKLRAHIARSSTLQAATGQAGLPTPKRFACLRRSASRRQAQAGTRDLQVVLGLKKSPRLIEAYDISNISGTLAVGSLVAAWEGIPKPARYRRFRIKTLRSADDVRMLAEVIRRRFTRLLAERSCLPDLVLVDGGLGQLRAAEAELKLLGLKSIPVAGLAKQFEKIFFGRRILTLSADSPALKVLQRLRDEAHRFAHTYHQTLRARRIRESRLDDIPGIGTSRKQMLLRHFGSVARLEKAPERAIAVLPGVGPALARQIKQTLAAAVTGRRG